MNRITSTIAIVGSIALLILSHIVPLENKRTLDILATLIIIIPALCMTFMLMLCTLAIFLSSGLRKFKAQWLSLAILFFALSDMLLKKKMTFWILQPDDIYHGLLSLGLLFLTQVASPKISKEELDSYFKQKHE